MKLLEQHNLSYEVVFDSLEDLWITTQLLSAGDKVKATTVRKVKIGSSESNQKQVKKIISVEVLVSKVSLEGEVLRISGTIQNETEHTSIGQFHTLSFSVTETLSFEKAMPFLDVEKKLFEKSLNSKSSTNLLLLLDREDLIATEFSDFSYSILFEKTGLGSKKYSREEIDENEQKFSLLADLLQRNYSSLILAGPGIYKENLREYLKSRISLKMQTFSFPDVRVQAVQRLIGELSKAGLVVSAQIVLEEEALSELMEAMGKGTLYAYGFALTAAALREGRVRKLLLSTAFLEERKEKEEYLSFCEDMRSTEAMGGSVVIVRSENEGGQRLDGLGGIAALLRY